MDWVCVYRAPGGGGGIRYFVKKIAGNDLVRFIVCENYSSVKTCRCRELLNLKSNIYCVMGGISTRDKNLPTKKNGIGSFFASISFCLLLAGYSLSQQEKDACPSAWLHSSSYGLLVADHAINQCSTFFLGARININQICLTSATPSRTSSSRTDMMFFSPARRETLDVTCRSSKQDDIIIIFGVGIGSTFTSYIYSRHYVQGF